jgi:hypothetical protein
MDLKSLWRSSPSPFSTCAALKVMDAHTQHPKSLPADSAWRTLIRTIVIAEQNPEMHMKKHELIEPGY